jgi:hypothetical protein
MAAGPTRTIVISDKYPEGMDLAWLASDRDGHLAAFVTGGSGPIPDAALRLNFVPLEDIESRICSIPKVSETRLLVTWFKHPESYLELAERGFFAYDWTDVHRTNVEAKSAYEQIAVPVNPINLAKLPDDLAALARALKFGDVAFEETSWIDVCAHMNCCKGRSF